MNLADSQERKSTAPRKKLGSMEMAGAAGTKAWLPYVTAVASCAVGVFFLLYFLRATLGGQGRAGAAGVALRGAPSAARPPRA